MEIVDNSCVLKYCIFINFIMPLTTKAFVTSTFNAFMGLLTLRAVARAGNLMNTTPGRSSLKSTW